MKRKIYLMLFISLVSTFVFAKDYYKLGCKALKRNNIEKAESYFLDGIYTILDSFSYEYKNLKYDLENAKNDSENINWQVYYYKGLLEGYFPFDYYTDIKYQSAFNQVEAIQSFEMSISIKDNYQSHIAKAYSLQFTDDDFFKEKEKAIKIAKSYNEMVVASNIEHGIGLTFEANKNYNEAKLHYKKSLEYSFDKDSESHLAKIEEMEKIGCKSITEYENYLLEKEQKEKLLAKAKENGFKTIEAYEKYLEKERQEEERRKQEKKRCSWENLKSSLFGVNHIQFYIGDIVQTPSYLLEIVDVDVSKNGFMYLVQHTGYPVGRCIQLISYRQLPYTQGMISQSLKIECQGISTYKHGYSFVDCYVFYVID